jgi:hypothetical protein
MVFSSFIFYERRNLMDEYKPNSHKSKEQMDQSPERKMEAVVSGPAIIKKKSDVRKFAEVFVAEDVNNVKSYILTEVILPYVKDAILDTVRVLLGKTKDGPNRGSVASKVSYRGHYERENERRTDANSNRRNVFDYDEIVFTQRGDAELVLDAMYEAISRYGTVSVADFYDLAEVSTRNYAANKYGWADLSGSRIVPVRGGYIIKLPKSLPLN